MARSGEWGGEGVDKKEEENNVLFSFFAAFLLFALWRYLLCAVMCAVLHYVVVCCNFCVLSVLVALSCLSALSYACCVLLCAVRCARVSPQLQSDWSLPCDHGLHYAS